MKFDGIYGRFRTVSSMGIPAIGLTCHVLYSKHPMQPFSDQEIGKIREAIIKKDPWFNIYFKFALYTGMRRSEILALTWHDVDLWNKREIIVPDPDEPLQLKRDARHIPVDEVLLGLLLDLRSPSRWVFQKTGRRMLGRNITLFFTELSQEMKVPVTSERMRWTWAVRLYHQINPQTKEEWKVLQKYFGHKEVATTKNYFHRNLADS